MIIRQKIINTLNNEQIGLSFTIEDVANWIKCSKSVAAMHLRELYQSEYLDKQVINGRTNKIEYTLVDNGIPDMPRRSHNAGRPRGKQKPIQVNIRVSQDEYDTLQQLAEDRQTTVSDVLRSAIDHETV